MKEWGKFKEAEEGCRIDNEVQRLSLEYGLEPFVLHNGGMGIHFMNIDYSAEYPISLEEYLAQDISDSSDINGNISKDSQEDLLEYRAVLTRMIKQIDDALKNQ
jgi:hypothetical protein